MATPTNMAELKEALNIDEKELEEFRVVGPLMVELAEEFVDDFGPSATKVVTMIHKIVTDSPVLRGYIKLNIATQLSKSMIEAQMVSEIPDRAIKMAEELIEGCVD